MALSACPPGPSRERTWRSPITERCGGTVRTWSAATSKPRTASFTSSTACCCRNASDRQGKGSEMRRDAVLDTLLDLMLGGYTSIGYRIRHRAWSADDLPRMEG